MSTKKKVSPKSRKPTPITNDGSIIGYLESALWEQNSVLDRIAVALEAIAKSKKSNEVEDYRFLLWDLDDLVAEADSKSDLAEDCEREIRKRAKQVGIPTYKVAECPNWDYVARLIKEAVTQDADEEDSDDELEEEPDGDLDFGFVIARVESGMIQYFRNDPGHCWTWVAPKDKGWATVFRSQEAVNSMIQVLKKKHLNYTNTKFLIEQIPGEEIKC